MCGYVCVRACVRACVRMCAYVRTHVCLNARMCRCPCGGDRYSTELQSERLGVNGTLIPFSKGCACFQCCTAD